MLDRTPKSIAQLIAARRPGHSLPADLYTRSDVFDVDMGVIFHNHWIYAGVEMDVPEAGDVCVIEFGKASVLIMRGDDEEVRAFHNVCRHRGARLLPPGQHSIGNLTCPYHQWTYRLDGDLIHTQHMGGDFDHACHGLKPVHLRSIGGLLFICLADTPPADIDDLSAVMEPRLAHYDLRNTKIAYQEDIVEEGNWKLVIENNRECYHCAGTHPELCNSFIALDFGYDPDSQNPEERAAAEAHLARYEAQTAAWEAMGFPSRAVEHLAGHATNFRTQRLIISGGGQSQSMDGKAVSDKLLGAHGRTDLGDVHLWTHNSWHHFMGDHALTFTVIPLSEGRTLVRSKWLVHKDAVEGVDYDLQKLIEVWRATNRQDADLVGMTHAGVSGIGYQPGPYSRFTEYQLENFATWYLERLTAFGYADEASHDR